MFAFKFSLLSIFLIFCIVETYQNDLAQKSFNKNDQETSSGLKLLHSEMEIRTLYDLGFRFMVNLNCLNYKIEIVLSDEFREKMKRVNCTSTTKLNREHCFREFVCGAPENIQEFASVRNTFLKLQRARCFAVSIIKEENPVCNVYDSDIRDYPF